MKKTIECRELRQLLELWRDEQEQQQSEAYIARCMSAGGPVDDSPHQDYACCVTDLPEPLQLLPELADMDFVGVDAQGIVTAWPASDSDWDACLQSLY